jgi:hypothetical protein
MRREAGANERMRVRRIDDGAAIARAPRAARVHALYDGGSAHASSDAVIKLQRLHKLFRVNRTPRRNRTRKPAENDENDGTPRTHAHSQRVYACVCVYACVRMCVCVQAPAVGVLVAKRSADSVRVRAEAAARAPTLARDDHAPSSAAAKAEACGERRVVELRQRGERRIGVVRGRV